MLRLFSYWRSSAAYRVRIALNLKELEHEIVPVSLAPGVSEHRGDAYRAKNPQMLVPYLEDGNLGISAHRDSFFRGLKDIELGDEVQRAIGMLSPKLRVVLALRYLEQMSYDELAATLSLSLGTVKSRLNRARLELASSVRRRVHIQAVPPAEGLAGGSA